MEAPEIKEIINLANKLEIDKRELFDFVDSDDENFEIGGYRFITHEEALKDCVKMYQCDEFISRRFNAGFIEDYITLDYDDIKTLQEGEQFSIIGKLILNSGNLEEMLEKYIRLNGYGHTLYSYDGHSDEITLNNIDYIYFKS